MSSGQMVEYLLMKRAFKENMIVPNKPDEEEYRRRVLTTYEGDMLKNQKRGCLRTSFQWISDVIQKEQRLLLKEKV